MTKLFVYDLTPLLPYVKLKIAFLLINSGKFFPFAKV